jgi:hypothetical protein
MKHLIFLTVFLQAFGSYKKSASDKMEQEYIMITQSECHEYLKSLGIKLSDFYPKVNIPSRMGVTYNLPDGRILLKTNKNNKDYPCFIYKDMEAFTKMKERGYYPIPDSVKTFLELETPYLATFPDSIEHFKNIVIEHTNIHPKEDMLSWEYCKEVFIPIKKI